MAPWNPARSLHTAHWAPLTVHGWYIVPRKSPGARSCGCVWRVLRLGYPRSCVAVIGVRAQEVGQPRPLAKPPGAETAEDCRASKMSCLGRLGPAP